MKKTHNKNTLVALIGLTCAGSLSAATTAYWRVEGIAGDAVGTATDSSGNGFDGSGSGGAAYSSEVPGSLITDPISGTTSPNLTSLNASSGSARVNTVNNVAFNTSFTVEAFIRLDGEPGTFVDFIDRNEAADARWQLDFDHGSATSFGRGRARFDSPLDGLANGASFGLPTSPTLSGEQRLYVDTPTGDGLVSSYVNTSNPENDGDDVNDLPDWHHIAVTYNQDTREATYFFDYIQGQTRTLADDFEHPDAVIRFGKLNSDDYGLFLDEVRYTDEVLAPNQFLVASNIPEPSSALLALIGVMGALGRRRR